MRYPGDKARAVTLCQDNGHGVYDPSAISVWRRVDGTTFETRPDEAVISHNIM